MNGIIVGALVALSMAQQKTDTVFPVGDAKTLEVSTDGGTIVVTAWDRNDVRIQADHSLRTTIDIRRTHGGERIDVESEARRGPGGIVDYRISVPRSLAVELDGMYTDITVTGLDAAVDAETMQGDVTVKGGKGSVKASTTTGKLLVDGAQGKIDATTAAGDIRFVNIAGDVTAESAGGDILFENAKATSVDVGTTGGRIQYDGTMVKAGTYLFGSYGGPVTLVLPEGTAASMTLSTIHGSVLNNMSGQMERLSSGKRHEVTLGGGGATVEVETFGGRIAVLKKGTEGALRQDTEGWQDGDWGDIGDVAADVAARQASRWAHFGEELGTRIETDVADHVDLRILTDLRERVEPRSRLRTRERRPRMPPDTVPATIHP